jgi:hypothetical protein
MMHTMKRLESFGRSLAAFTRDDVLKLHFVSQFSDICVSLQDLNYHDIHLKSLVEFHPDDYWIKKRTNGISASVSRATRSSPCRIARVVQDSKQYLVLPTHEHNVSEFAPINWQCFSSQLHVRGILDLNPSQRQWIYEHGFEYLTAGIIMAIVGMEVTQLVMSVAVECRKRHRHRCSDIDY